LKDNKNLKKVKPVCLTGVSGLSKSSQIWKSAL